MDQLLKKILDSAGISGYEKDIASIMKKELEKSCDSVEIDSFGNVIAKKGKGPSAGSGRGKKKIMVCAHMDEVGLLVKHITKEGYIHFIKVGGIDDRILLGNRVIIKAKNGDVVGIIGSKAPHLQKEEEKNKVTKHDEMFIDIGAKSREDALKRISIADQVIFEPNSGVLHGKLYYGKAADDRIGCYALIKIMERLKKTGAEIYAVATTQEEVGLKGARTSSFRIDPDFAIAVDTTIAGDNPGIREQDSSLKVGEGVCITIIEASGRGIIVSEKIKDMFIAVAKKNKIKHQIDVLEGGMTDGAMIYMNRAGVPTGVLSIPCRYLHAPTGVFSIDDVDTAIELAIKVIEQL